MEVWKALSSITQQEEVIETLKNADAITTSVKRENLKYLVPVILKAWGDDPCTGKAIICCENVENVGIYFKNLLMEQCSEKQKENIQKIREIGVDFVSSGALTHSAPILDISMKNLHAV